MQGGGRFHNVVHPKACDPCTCACFSILPGSESPATNRFVTFIFLNVSVPAAIAGVYFSGDDHVS